MNGKAKRQPSLPIWPRAHPPFVRAMLAGHSALGLAFAALIFLVCFSGSIAVFAPDLGDWEQAAPNVVYSGPLDGEHISTIVQNGRKLAPWAEDASITLPSKTDRHLSLLLSPDLKDKAHEPKRWYADSAGRLAEVTAQAPFTGFIAGLHTSLHLEGGVGGFIVGAAGVALLSSLISGLFSHPRVFRDAFNLRLGGHKRLQEVDIHNRLGVWALPFHILISLSGALLGLTILIVGILALAVFKGDTQKAYALFSGPHPVEDLRPAPVPDFQVILADIKIRAPQGQVAYIMVEHVGTVGADVNVNVTTPTHASRGETYVYDRAGKYYGAWGNETGTLGQRIYMVLAPLHFGSYGGWPVKIAYFLLGLSLTSVTSSGVAIWLARRRDKGRPAPRFERLWTATVWSQPFAYAVSGIYALLAHPADDDQIIPIWASVTALSFLMTLFMPPVRLSLILRGLAVAGLLALVGVHMREVLLPALSGAQATTMMWGGDIVMIAAAVLLAISMKPNIVTGVHRISHNQHRERL